MQTSSHLARQAFAVFFGTLMFLADLGPVSADATLNRDFEELSHELTIHIDGMLATVTARQRLANQASIDRAAIYEFELPASAVLTGMTVTLANGHKSKSIAVDADAAITPVPDADSVDAAPDPGLLRLVEVDMFEQIHRYELRVATVARGRSVVVERTWVQPVDYEDGRLRLRLPDRGRAKNLVDREVSLTVRAPGGATGLASVFGAGKRLAKKTGVKTSKLQFREAVAGDLAIEATPLFPDGSGPRAEYVAVSSGDIGGVLGISVINPRTTGDTFASFENIVIAVDVSRSMGKDGVAAAAEIADAILLTSDPAARIEVVMFDRGARRVFGKLIHNSRDARAVLAESLSSAKLRNGSDLGKAIDKLSKIVESTPTDARDVEVEVGGRAATLVAVISDGMTPVGLSADEALSRFGGMAIAESEVVSITVVPDGAPVPDPGGDPLEELIRRTGGRAIAVRHTEAKSRGRLVLAELTRSTALELPSVSIASDDTANVLLPRRIEPGQGVLVFGDYIGKAPGKIAVNAADGVKLSASRGSKSTARAVRSLVLASRVLDEDSNDVEGRRQLLAAIAASPVVGRHTSLVAVDRSDAFARDRLATIKKWGSGQFRRMVSETERRDDGDPLEPLDIVQYDTRSRSATASWEPQRPTGELDGTIIKRLITLHVIPKARACYEKELRRDHTVHGDLTLRVEMARGEVQLAGIDSSDVRSAAVERCVIDAAYTIPVPKVAQGETLEVTYLARYPLRFRLSTNQNKGRVRLGDPKARPKPLKQGGDRTDPLDGIDN